MSELVNGLNTFNDPQREVLMRLRARYAEDGDRFTPREMAYLSFLRWLAERGALEHGVESMRRATRLTTALWEESVEGGEDAAESGGREDR